ncbi:hypothetical protein EU522_01465 [Candidatus Thorarchaeota archaeon]|nr:MAG: hypothetical protein EU522_01465 [Candidatus Thorarchaeota archaeon]
MSLRKFYRKIASCLYLMMTNVISFFNSFRQINSKCKTGFTFGSMTEEVAMNTNEQIAKISIGESYPEYGLCLKNLGKGFDGNVKMIVLPQILEGAAKDNCYSVVMDGEIVGTLELSEQYHQTAYVENSSVESESINWYVYMVEKAVVFDNPIKIRMDVSDDWLVRVARKQYNEGKVYKTVDTEERIIAAAVLVPNVVDLHGHIYNEDTVRQAAYYFMENYLTDLDHGIDVNHGDVIIPDAIKVVQSFILDEEKTYKVEVPALSDEHPMKAASEITFPAGTWIIYARVVSDALWSQVKKGELMSWSIAGLAVFNDLDDNE